MREKIIHLFVRMGKSETFQGLIILLLPVLIFLSTPLIQSKDHYFSSADFLQPYSLLQIEPDYTVKNGLLGDPAVNTAPWYLYNRENILAGKIPLWNPYNGNGVPHLANFQSAVFSPTTLPFYIFTVRQAFILAALLKLYPVGLFTFFFLKKLGLFQVPALAGGIAFMFSGIMTMFIGYPLPAAVIVLPAGLYFSQVIFSRISQNQRQIADINPTPAPKISWRTYFWPLVGLSLSLVAGIFGGHPEIFFFSFLPVAAFILFQLVHLAVDQGFNRARAIFVVKVAGHFILAGLFSVALAAVQLLPFLEYLVRTFALSSPGREGLTAGKGSLPVDVWPLQVFPTLLGSPSNGQAPIDRLTHTNFIEANTSYVGSFILFLAIFSLVHFRKNIYIQFFSVVGGIWFIYAYNILGLGNLFRVIPGVANAPIQRSQVIWDICLCCLAALFLQYLWSRKKEFEWAWSTAILVGGLTFLAIAFIGVQQVLREKSNLIQSVSKAFIEFMPGQLAFLVVTFTFGIIGVAFLFLSNRVLARRIVSVLLLIIVFLQSGYLLRDFYPTIDDGFFYPVTDSIKQIQQITAGNGMAIIGDDTIIADTNMVYKLSLPSSYDGAWLKNTDELSAMFFASTNFVRSSQDFSEKGLKLFGTDYIVASANFMDFGKNMLQVQNRATREYYTDEILPGKSLVQTFKSTVGNLQGVTLVLHSLNRRNTCNLEFLLEDISAGSKVINRQNFGCSEVVDNAHEIFKFAPIADSTGKQYRITLSSSDSHSGNAVVSIAKSDLPYSDGKLTLGSEVLKGGLLFGYINYNQDVFKQVATFSRLNMYQYLGSLSKYHMVYNTLYSQSDAATLATLQKNDFDPANTVVISSKVPEDLPANTNPGTFKVNVVSQATDQAKLRVSSTTPGYLVIAQSFYPGWKAKVNGRETPVLQANYAFSAIEIKDANSEIDFYYDPDSFRFGWYLGLAALILGLVLAILWKLKKPAPKILEVKQVLA